YSSVLLGLQEEEKSRKDLGL
ncbi:TPA: uracil-DNA glycosylase, partial [Staphylococcus aureus]